MPDTQSVSAPRSKNKGPVLPSSDDESAWQELEDRDAREAQLFKFQHASAQALASAIKLRISDFAERAICYEEGRPIRLHRRPWIQRIIDSEHLLTRKKSDGSWARPRRWTLLRTARQCEKSTALSLKLFGTAMLVPNLTCLYVSSAGANTREFADTRVENTLRISPILSFLAGKRLLDNTTVKRFANNSRFVLRSVYQHSASRVRGIPADVLTIDEVQDMLPDVLPIAFACLKHSELPYGPIRALAGTPLTTDNIIEQLWRKESTQNTWMTKCPCCRHFNSPGFEQIGKTGMICEKCGRALNPLDGQWVRMGRHDAPYEGYHLSQVMMPYTVIDNVELFEAKWEEFYNDIHSVTASEGKKRNELLGEAWDIGRKPLTEENIRSCCRSNIRISRKADIVNDVHWPIFMGVDWGEGGEDNAYTVATLLYAHGDLLTPRVFCVKRYEGPEADPVFVKHDLARFMEENHVTLACVDAGYGWGIIAELREIVPDSMRRIIPVRYSAGSHIISWDKFSGELRAHRTRWMSKIFQLIRRGSVEFPCEADFWDPFAQDLLNIHAERTSLDQLIYSKVDTDDSFHSLLYALTAKMYFYEEIEEFANA